MVFLVISDSTGLGGIWSISTNSPPSTEVVSFDWNHLEEPNLPLSILFHIVVKSFNKNTYRTIVDEVASVSILLSTAWKALGSPRLVLPTNHFLSFNR